MFQTDIQVMTHTWLVNGWMDRVYSHWCCKATTIRGDVVEWSSRCLVIAPVVDRFRGRSRRGRTGVEGGGLNGVAPAKIGRGGREADGRGTKRGGARVDWNDTWGLGHSCGYYVRSVTL